MDIVDIKKKVDSFKDDWERSKQRCDMEDFSDEVLYLLSIIEQAGNDLSETIDLMIGDRHGEAWERTHETYKLLRTGYK